MAGDPEVSAKLKVTREGDPKAFTEVGEAARDLGERVREIKPALEAGADALDEIAKAAKESAPDVAEATSALSTGLRDLAGASSSGEIKAGIDEIATSMERLGELGEGATGDLKKSLEDLPDLLEKAKDVADDLEGSLEATSKAAAKIEVPAAAATGLKSTADGVERLRGAVASLDAPVSKFKGDLGGLQQPLAEGARGLGEIASTAREASPAIADAAENVANALLRLGQSEGLDELQTDLAAAAEAMEKLKTQGTESVEGLEDAVTGLEEQLSRLKSSVDRVADPLTQSFDDASEKVQDFAKKADAGLAGTKTSGAAAQRAIADLEAEITRLRAAGEHVSDAQIEGLEKLKAAHHAAIEEVAKNAEAQRQFKKESEEAGRAVSGQIKPIHDFVDLLEGIDPRLAKVAARVGLIYGGLKVATEVMEKTHEVLGGLAQAVGIADEAFERWWSRIPNGINVLHALGESIGDFQGSIESIQKTLGIYADDQQELNNIYAILRQNGIDPTRLSLDEAREAYDRLNQSVQVSQTDAQKLRDELLGTEEAWKRQTAAVERFLGSLPPVSKLSEAAVEALRKKLEALGETADREGRDLPKGILDYAKAIGAAVSQNERLEAAARKTADSQGLTIDALTKKGDELVRVLFEVAEASKGALDDSDLGEIAKKNIQGLIDQAEKLGVSLSEISPTLADYAEHWGIVGSAAEAAAKKNAAAVDSLVAKISGLSVSRDQLRDLGRNIVEAARQLGDIRALEFKNPEAFERLKEEVQKVIDAYLSLGEKVPAALAAVGDSVGVVVGALDRADDVQRAFAAGGDAIVARSGRVAVALSGERESIISVASASEDAAQRTSSASQQGAAAVERANQTIVASAEATRVKVRTAADGHREIYNDLGVGAATAAEKVAAAGETAASGAAGFDQVAEAAKRGSQIAEVGDKARSAGEGVKSGGEAAASSEKGYSSAAEGLEKFDHANAGAVASVAALKTEIEDLETRFGSLLKIVEKVIPALEELPTRWHAAIDSTITDLQRLVDKLDEVEGGAAAVTNAEGN